MSSFNCNECGQRCVDTDDGYITGCEHHPIQINNHPERRTSFLELIMLHQCATNPITASSYKEIIIKRVNNQDYT
ncbi:MAG: hypothetical protein QM500_19925 [Methylococcales bacterium]